MSAPNKQLKALAHKAAADIIRRDMTVGGAREYLIRLLRSYNPSTGALCDCDTGGSERRVLMAAASVEQSLASMRRELRGYMRTLLEFTAFEDGKDETES